MSDQPSGAINHEELAKVLGITPGPWLIHSAGGHAPASIRGTGEIHTNGRARNAQGVSSASYSELVCEIPHDLSLPGPKANAQLIASAPEMALELDRLRKRVREMEAALRKISSFSDIPLGAERAAIAAMQVCSDNALTKVLP